jgi:hypothetical protein
MTINKLRIGGAVALMIAIPGLANAQQSPGTNVPTPPPGQTPISLTTSPALGVDSSSPAGVAASSPTLAQEPVIDAETTSKSIPNRPLLVTGVLLLGLSYAPAAVVAATSDREADEKLYYPVAGPWLDLNHRGCAANPCANNDLHRGLLVADGIVQGAGALGVLLSLVLPEKTTRHWYLIGNRDVVVAPQVGGSLVGLRAVGQF